MSTRTALVLLVFLLAQISPPAAQTGADPHRYDLRIEHFYEKNQRDSFLFYTGEKSRLARQSGDLALWGWTQVDLHDWYSEHKNDEEALKILDAAWQQRWREPKNPEEWEPFLYIQQNRGWCLFEAGKVWQAVQAYESAAQLYERYRYPDFEAVEAIYKPLGTHYTRLGDNEKAILVFEKALLLGGDNESLAGLYNNIGIAHWNRGDLSPAILAFGKGLDLRQVSTAKSALLQSGLAQAMIDAGKIHEAYTIAYKALDMLPKRPDNRSVIEYRIYARRTAGLAAAGLGRFVEAETRLAGALSDATFIFGEYSRDVGKIEVARSGVLREQGDLPAAVEAANRALRAVLPMFKPAAPKDNPGAGSFYEENVIFEALEAKALAAESMYQKNPDPAWLVLALDCHNLAWQAEMRLRQVHQYSSSKLDLQKNARMREESAMRVTRLLFEKTGQSQYMEKAFAITERSKATLLLEAVHENLVRQGAAGEDGRFNQIDALRRSLAYFERSLLLEPENTKVPQWRLEADEIGSRIGRIERELSAAYPLLANPATTPVEALPGPGDLATDETLITYFVRGNTLDVIVLENSKPVAWHIPPYDNALKALANRFFSFFNNSAAILSEPDKYLETAFALWQKIVPAEAVGAGRLLIVPDGFLNFIPFEALVVASPGSGVSLRNAAYLLRRQEVRYTWSLAVLRQQNHLPARADRFMLVVAPGFANGERSLAPLTTNHKEWQSAGRGVTVLQDKEAGLKQLMGMAGQYRILHFSTHAFSDANPRIELFDQSLLLPDIYTLPLKADLVVLSACQTGLGLEQKGEGVMSLTRAFAQAGTASIVSSLWSVNNRSTADLLDWFYQNLRKNMTPGAALRQSKLAYIADPKINAARQSPYFWAGMVFMGADRKTAPGGFQSPFAWLFGGIAAAALLFLSFRYVNRHKTIS